MTEKELAEFIGKIDASTKQRLLKLLQQEKIEVLTSTSVRTTLLKDQVISCPNCQSTNVVGDGKYRTRKRFSCKGCKRSFNELTGTTTANLKKVDKWQKYLDMMPNQTSIRKAAKELSVSTKTVFDWRHKILSSLTNIAPDSMIGIVESDDKLFDLSEKGSKKLDRAPYERPSDRETKRGVSNDKVSVVVSSDRHGNAALQITKIGRIDNDSIERTLGIIISKENILCTDAHPTYISWAANKKLEHHTFIVSKKQRVSEKVYHVQHVNSLDNRLERWLTPFYGVATKYLQNYLLWFITNEKLKGSKTIEIDFLKAVMASNKTQHSWQNIEDRYSKLIHPQHSTT